MRPGKRSAGPGWGSPPCTALFLIPRQPAAMWPFPGCDLQDGQRCFNYTNHTALPGEEACQRQGRLLTFTAACCSFQTPHLPLSRARSPLSHLARSLASSPLPGNSFCISTKPHLMFQSPSIRFFYFFIFLLIYLLLCQNVNAQLLRARY